ncbi:MAG: protein TolR [Burkholderiales bacterium]|jgi:biopolymer transport protein TolR|nr:protein TolR [Burkholderiales bacterium]
MPRVRKAINEMNVVPYIDVMLVLLIIFMVTAPLVAPGEIELPNVGSATITPKQPFEITVRSDGQLLLRNRAKPNEPAQRFDTEGLIAQLIAQQQESPDQAVVIAADKSVRYETVVAVLDTLQRHQIKKVGLLVVPGAK